MIVKYNLLKGNNYCVTSHKMTMENKNNFYFNTKFLKCLQEDLFVTKRNSPNFKYDKWLTRE